MAAWITAGAAQAFAVWPPSTSLDEGTKALPASNEVEGLPTVLHRDVHAVMNKFLQDERRLEKVIKDLKDDETALKQLSQEGSYGHGGSH